MTREVSPEQSGGKYMLLATPTTASMMVASQLETDATRVDGHVIISKPATRAMRCKSKSSEGSLQHPPSSIGGAPPSQLQFHPAYERHGSRTTTKASSRLPKDTRESRQPENDSICIEFHEEGIESFLPVRPDLRDVDVMLSTKAETLFSIFGFRTSRKHASVRAKKKSLSKSSKVSASEQRTDERWAMTTEAKNSNKMSSPSQASLGTSTLKTMGTSTRNTSTATHENRTGKVATSIARFNCAVKCRGKSERDMSTSPASTEGNIDVAKQSERRVAFSPSTLERQVTREPSSQNYDQNDSAKPDSSGFLDFVDNYLFQNALIISNDSSSVSSSSISTRS